MAQIISGRNADVDTAAEDVWGQGGLLVPPTVARIHDIVSSDANDDGSPAGTGARTLEVFGLDSSGDEISEVVTLDGTTNVATVNSYIFINRMKVLTAGSTGSNAGAITATAQTDATVSSQIAIGDNESLTCFYRVPNGAQAKLLGWGASMRLGSQAVDFELVAQSLGGVFQVKDVILLFNQGTNSFYKPSRLTFGQDTIIKVQATSSAVDAVVAAEFTVNLV